MAKRALVVGSETDGLSGANGDARRMAEALCDWYDFEVDLRTGDAATREGILAGYRRLIDASESDDAALVYYSGHGAFVEGAGPEGKGLRHAQCIVPFDYHETTDEKFHGILALELSLWLARLTAKTKNAVVVLDCCHAAGMSRDPSARPKALQRPIKTSFELLDAQLQLALKEQQHEFAGLDPESNPHAVRLVATSLRNYAWEYTKYSGESVGAFSEALLLALDEAKGQRVTWEAIGDRVREQVLAAFPAQRPEVEGPARRMLFERVEGDATGALMLAYDKSTGRHVLRGGRVHGVHEGDEYGLMLQGSAEYDAKKTLGTAKVVEVGASESVVELQRELVRPRPIEAALAFRLRSAAARRLVRIEAPEFERAAIAKALSSDPILRVADGEADKALPLLAKVLVAGEQIALIEPWGKPAIAPLPYNGHALRELKTNLHRMAAVQRLRELKSEPSAGLPERAIEVSWGRVEGGRPSALKDTGELLAVGQSVFVKVRNVHPDKKNVHVSIVDLGVAKKVTLLTRSWPSGRELRFDEEYVFGTGRDGELKGAKLGWSDADGVPKDEPRPETILVIATEKPQNLLPVEQPGVSSTATWGAGGSALSQLVARAQNGGTRDLGSDQEAEGFLVRQLDFQLSPWPMSPPPEETFLVDDRPPASAIAFAPTNEQLAKSSGGATPLAGALGELEAHRPVRGIARGFGALGTVPKRLALRINELIVHDVRTLFGGGDVRVDALIITRQARPGRLAPGATPGPGEAFLAFTRKFPGVCDGDRLSLDNALIYEGEVRDFVDLRLWVSRGRDEAKTLSEMMQEELNSDEFQKAAATIVGLTAVAPQAGALVAAVGAAATVGKIAWQLLSGALPKSIGVYQTSLLAAEGFKVGRHPAEGRYRAQGFSFGYEVLAAG